MISIIVATAKDGVIGKTGGIPWYLPADLAHFKHVTTGHPVIMGRVTHESIGRALPNRRNIIISSNTSYLAKDCDVTNSLQSAIKLVKDSSEIFVIGGSEIYIQALPIADRIYLTKIDAQIKGDRFFKYLPEEWIEVSRVNHKKNHDNPYEYSFIVLERKPSAKIKA